MITILLLIALVTVPTCYVVHRKNKSALHVTTELELQQHILNDKMALMQKGWQILESEIEKQELIASGAFGSVYKGRWGHISVAIKTLHQGITELDPDAVSEFREEAHCMQAIRHPNLVTFYGGNMGITKDAAKSFLVFEMMDMGSLRALLKNKERALSWPLRKQFAHDVAKGMPHLHSIPMIHRDLKSDNVLIGADMHAKVADFGQSKLIKRSRLASVQMSRKLYSIVDTLTSSKVGEALNTVAHKARGLYRPSIQENSGVVEDLSPTVRLLQNDTSDDNPLMTTHVGTPLWKAPELLLGESQAQKQQDYSNAIDVYSFGIIMWELLTRDEPWSTIKAKTRFTFLDELTTAVLSGYRPPIPQNPECPESYLVLMRACWMTEPDKRPVFSYIESRLV